VPSCFVVALDASGALPHALDMNTRARTRALIFAQALALTLVPGLISQPAAAADLDIRVDPRVELTAVLCRLADFEEYQTRGIPAYDRAVREHFEAFTNHPAVGTFRKLRASHHIGYNAPIGLALVADPVTWKPRVTFEPMPSWLDTRWSPESATNFLAALAQFATDTKALEFFAGQSPICHAVQTNLSAGIRTRLDLGWFSRQFGEATNARFVLVAGLLNGPQNYGAEVRLPTGASEIFAVVGTPAFDVGQPIQFPVDQMMQLIVHEFSHTFANPWVDAHARELDPPGEKLFSIVGPQMRRQAYSNPRVMLYESVVRGNTIRYFQDHADSASAAACIKEDCAKSFFWTGDLAALLGGTTGSIPRLAVATPALLGFINDWGAAPAEKLAAVKARLKAADRQRLAKGPQIIKAVPADGDQEVDASLATLELHFDRPMTGAVAVYGETPEISGKPAWDAEKRVLKIPVKLESGRSYDLRLNNSEKPDAGFRSEQGEPLAWQQWSFRAR